WKQNWRSEIKIYRNEQEYSDAFAPQRKEFRRWYHINVKNLHRQKIALDCLAYLESSKNILTGIEKIFPPVEFKWQALNVPRIIIPPSYTRGFDAFFVSHETPHIVNFGINRHLVDYSGLYEVYKLEGPGTFELNFVVFSINFAPIRQSFLLDIGSRLDDIKFSEKSKEKEENS
ncbi:MAG TPA: hypothetical protein VE076_13555, partial [Nitrososphaeraceae archaeon]|nr:hypothetical protein [Nitrososphaeraceae archaeon]